MSIITILDKHLSNIFSYGLWKISYIQQKTSDISNYTTYFQSFFGQKAIKWNCKSFENNFVRVFLYLLCKASICEYFFICFVERWL